MKAVRKLKKGKGNIELVDVPKPEIGLRDILMKVWAAGVCGSDLNIEDDTHFYRAPVTIGHEYSGIVEEVGRDVKKVKVGDKIVADIEAPEGWLGVEIDGSYAEYMRIPEVVVHKCPSDMDLDAAALCEPVAASIHCFQERNTINAGDFVVVIGPGPMGMLAVQFARLRGARKIVLVGLRSDEGRLKIGKKIGADKVFYCEDCSLQEIMEMSEGGADFVADCAGTGSGTQFAIDVARPANTGQGGKGKITLVAMWGKPITLNLDKVSMKQLDFKGSWSWNGSETWDRAINLLYGGFINYRDMITSRYKLEEWKIAFKNLREKKDVKAFIHPNGIDWKY
ncbi:alcohol dehydrogenase catalytic domain-containing protein [Candidatus Aerophobetes bacterium]|nr:alcohol dehydrogenase catalytic domain-containing protein [Candidatus Aerophobetes bacterium]